MESATGLLKNTGFAIVKDKTVLFQSKFITRIFPNDSYQELITKLFKIETEAERKQVQRRRKMS